MRAALATLVLALASAAQEPVRIRVEHTVTYDPRPEPARWIVETAVHGLDARAGAPVLEIQDWGEWTRLDAYYLTELAGEPPTRALASGHELACEPPDGWDGSWRVRYAIPVVRRGSKAHGLVGLAPFRDEGWALGFSANTLGRPTKDGTPLPAERRVELVAPAGWTIASGLGGVSTDRQAFALPPDVDNTAIAFARAPFITSLVDRAPRIDAVQLAARDDSTAPLARFARRYLDACAETTGRPVESLRILVLEDGGGTRTEGSICIGYPEGIAQDPVNPWLAHFLAHELYHNWLGGFVRPEEGMPWFHEGFTEYLSLWHLARAGLVSRAWFRERILDLERELREHPTPAPVAFADRGVRWRDGDGPYELRAYKGAAVLALGMDATLRARGEPGVASLVADLIALGGRASLETLERWAREHGLEDFWGAHVAGSELPDAAESLVRAGYRATPRPEPLTYLGIETDAGTRHGTVLAVDPAGPAAAAGVRAGDVITGYYPARPGERPRVDAAVQTRYRFGLDGFDPGREGAFVGVLRDGEDVRVMLEPRLIEGGTLCAWSEDDDALDAFFE